MKAAGKKHNIASEHSECELWTGYVRPDGYGQWGRSLPAHRYVWIGEYGEVPEGLEIHHICGNRTCVKLDHLEAITRAEHMRKDGRMAASAERGRRNPPNRWGNRAANG